MNPSDWLPFLLGIAVLMPLASFATILVIGRIMRQTVAAYLAVTMIVGAMVCSLAALGIWSWHHYPSGASHHAAGHGDSHDPSDPGHDGREDDEHADSHELEHQDEHGSNAESASHEDHHDVAHAGVQVYTGNWYTLGTFGKLQLTIGYYIDALTVCMFCMVTIIASCIHFYAMGYMHEELHEVTDHEVTLSDGSHLHRPGRYNRFFQYLSLFCFSMLGVVISGNIAMTFVFWELVGICSYFLIGFYIERKSASTAANKAFIVNRVGDFGMIIGLMAIWASLGTFAFGDIDGQPGVFSQIRPGPEQHPAGAEHAFEQVVPDGMVRLAASEQIAEIVRGFPLDTPEATIETEIENQMSAWRDPEQSGTSGGLGYWLLVIAGVGIFCGCVGKSAQFPLHTWLPDAMEGPTPVSALVHSATMVAAGVYLVARFYPVFTPEVLLVIAVTGCITLFIAATIAITATDIKRVLAYSTVSQLGYMMLALGVGGWLAGVLHLFTHAFFKSLLFMCSGSVIHAVHTNEMPLMGGLRKKMPWTAYTMLVGCLAIAGAGIPFLIGLSGYYSKDAILEQALSFCESNSTWGPFFFYAAAGGAAITAFYMFRLWYMTFCGPPRDQHRYDHAHESPRVMYVPLVILALFAIGVAWKPTDWNLSNLLEQARPAGTAATVKAVMVDMVWPDEHIAHAPENFSKIVVPATLIAFGTALSGFLLATVFYAWRILDPKEVSTQFRGLYRFLLNKWWFDELYDRVFVRPTLAISRVVAGIDRRWIDGLIDGLARLVRSFSSLWDRIADGVVVDGFVNAFAKWMYSLGLSLREMQTGRLRQYVMFIVVGTVAVFVLVSFFWSFTLAQ